MNRIYLVIITLVLLSVVRIPGVAQTNVSQPIFKPFVNQAGYNIGESKRFVCYGASDNTTFKIINTKTSQTVFEGTKTGLNTGIFSAKYSLTTKSKGKIKASYGYMFFEKSFSLPII